MHSNGLKGLGVAMVTPMRSGGEIDRSRTEQLVNYLLEYGVDFLVLLGTTGEAPTLTEAEQREFLHVAIETVRGRVPVVVGCSGNNTAELTTRLSRFDYEGVDYILSATPAYNKPSQKGIYAHFSAVAKASERPVILYNVPGRTGVNMHPKTVCQLAREVENIAGIKDASGDIEQTAYLLAHRPEGFVVLSGDDSLTLPMMSLGAEGVISVLGNILPGQFGELVHHALDNDCRAAAKIHLQLLPLYGLLFEEGNPAGVKAALAELGICLNALRLPLLPVSSDLQDRISEALRPFRD